MVLKPVYFVIACVLFVLLCATISEGYSRRHSDRVTTSKKVRKVVQRLIRRQSDETPQARPSLEYFSSNSMPYSSNYPHHHHASLSSSNIRGGSTSDSSSSSSSSSQTLSASSYSFPDKIRYASLTDPASTSAPTRQPTTIQSSRNRNRNNQYSSSSYRHQSSSSPASSYPQTSYSGGYYGSNRQPSYNSQQQGQYYATTNRQTSGSSSNPGSYSPSNGYYSNPSSSSERGGYSSSNQYQNPYGSSSQNYYSTGYPSNAGGYNSRMSSGLMRGDTPSSSSSTGSRNNGEGISYQGSDIRIGSSSTRYDYSNSGGRGNGQAYPSQSSSNYPYSGRYNQQNYQYSQMPNPYSATFSAQNGQSRGGQDYSGSHRGYSGYSGSNRYGSQSYGERSSQYYPESSSSNSYSSQMPYRESRFGGSNGYAGGQTYNDYGSDASYGGYGSQQPYNSYGESSFPQRASAYGSSNAYYTYGTTGSSSETNNRNSGGSNARSPYGTYGGFGSSQDNTGTFSSSRINTNAHSNYGSGRDNSRTMPSHQNTDSSTEYQHGSARTSSRNYYESDGTGASHYHPNTNRQSSNRYSSVSSNSRTPSSSSSTSQSGLYFGSSAESPETSYRGSSSSGSSRGHSYYDSSQTASGSTYPSSSYANSNSHQASISSYSNREEPPARFRTSSGSDTVYQGSNNEYGNAGGSSRTLYGGRSFSAENTASRPNYGGPRGGSYEYQIGSAPSSQQASGSSSRTSAAEANSDYSSYSSVYGGSGNVHGGRTYYSSSNRLSSQNGASVENQAESNYMPSATASSTQIPSYAQSFQYGDRSDQNGEPYQNQQNYYETNDAVSSNNEQTASQPPSYSNHNSQGRHSSETQSNYFVSSEASSSRNDQSASSIRISPSGSQPTVYGSVNNQQMASPNSQSNSYSSSSVFSSNVGQSGSQSSIYRTSKSQDGAETQYGANAYGSDEVGSINNAPEYRFTSRNSSSVHLPINQQQILNTQNDQDSSGSSSQNSQHGSSINSVYADRGSPYDSPMASDSSRSASSVQLTDAQSSSQQETSQQDSVPSQREQVYQTRGSASNDYNTRTGTLPGRNGQRSRGSSFIYRSDSESTASSFSNIYSLPSRSRSRQHYGGRYGSSPPTTSGRNSISRGRIYSNGEGVTVVEQGNSIYQAGYDDDDAGNDYNNDYNDNDASGGQDATASNQNQQVSLPLNQRARNPSIPEDTSQTLQLPDLEINKYKLTTNFFVERKSLSELECARSEGCLSSSANFPSLQFMQRKLLRFQTTVKNIGRVAFRPKLKPSDWIWHQCHNHLHSMKVFTHYDLLNSSGAKVAEGHKASFCLEDSSCPSSVQKVYDCEKGHQGISPGCEDTYRAGIDCQWIDITGVFQDEYKFRVLVNPDRLVPESNYENNGLECSVEIKRNYAQIWGCRHIGV